MKTFLILICLISTISYTGCDKRTETKRLADEHVKWQDYQREAAKGMVRELVYVKDARTGLVYAYAWGGPASGGPVLVLVPKDSVPPELITITNESIGK